MAEKVGEIYYDVDLDTAQMIAANQKARQELDNLGNQAKGAAAGVKTLETQMKTSAAAVNQATKSGGAFRSQFQQAGYQIQDFIVQVQGGQSALVAFSQQGSQLAGAFGPGGAVAGAVIALGSVLAGVLMSALGSSSNKMKELQSAAEALNKVVVINSQGVAALSNDYARLAATNAALATQLRDAAVAKYAAEVENARKAISNIAEEQSSWWRSLSGGVASITAAGNALETLNIKSDDFRSAITQANEAGTAFRSSTQTLLTTVDMMASKFDISEQSAFTLVKQLNDLARNPTPENVTRISQSLASMKSTTDDGRLALANFRDELTKAGASAAQAEQAVKDLEASIGRMKTEAQVANFDSLTKGLNQQLIALKQGKQAAVEYAISQQDLTEEQKQSAIALSRQVASAEADAAAKKKAEQASSKLASAEDSVAQKLENLRQKAAISGQSTAELSRQQSILQAQQSLGNKATQQQIDLAGQYAAKAYDNAAAIKAQAEAEKQKQEAQKNFTSLQGQVSPIAASDNTYQQQMAQLDQYVQLYPQKIAEAEAVRIGIEQQYRQQRLDAMWQEWSQQSEINELAANAFDALGNNASRALSGILTGTESAGEAVRGLANSVVNQLLNSFVQMGVEWVKSSVMGAAAQQTAIAATTATQVSAIGTTTAASTASAATTMTAWLPAALVASIGSFGAAAVVGGAALLASFALISGLSGKRKNGGPVSAGGLYQVGEGGMPEIYRASNGSQYMIPGDNGSVISNKDLSSGGSGQIQVSIQFNDYTSGSHTYDAQASQNGNTVTVQAFIMDMNQGGPMSQSITTNLQTSRRATE